MDGPISPRRSSGSAGNELPAYMSNGVVGLKVRDNPLTPGMALLSGFSGEHPERKIEAAAFAPYPVAGDICLEGVWMSDAPQCVRVVDQAYDFSTAELTTRLNFKVGGRQAKIVVMSFCSREQPTVVCQEIAIDVDAASDLKVRARIDSVRNRRARAAIQPRHARRSQTFLRRVAALGKRGSDFDMRTGLRDRVRWR